MSGPMTEPREALATSICSTFDMGHHHHEAFLQPDHCDDGLSDADELLRSLRAQGYSVARSEGPGLDAPSLDEGLRAAAQAVVDQADPDDDPEGQYIDREALTDRLQEAILDLDSRQLMAEAQGYSSAEWRRWTAREIAEDLARQVARSEGPGLDALREARKAMSDRHDDLMWCNKDDDCHIQAKGVEVAIADFDAALAAQENPTPVRSTPSLDEGLLARALRTSSVGPYREGDLWTPDAWFAAYARSVAREYRRLAQEGETP